MDLREQRILDLQAEIFQEDSDVLDALEMYVRGFYSKRELADRLEFLATSANIQAADRFQREEDEKAEDYYGDSGVA